MPWRSREPISTSSTSTADGSGVATALTLDDGTLAGADIDFPGSLRVLVRDVGLPQAAALAMATRIPAELIGQAGRIGCLAPGARADLVHLGPQFELREVWRGGKVLQS